MSAYRIWRTVMDTNKPASPNDIIVTELYLRLTSRGIGPGGWHDTTIHLFTIGKNVEVFNYTISHPQHYPITPDNWYAYLTGYVDVINRSGGEFEIVDTHGEDNPEQDMSLHVQEIAGCTFIEAGKGGLVSLILINPDEQRDNGVYFDASYALQVFDHDYNAALEDFSYTVGINTVSVSLPSSDSLVDGVTYFIPIDKENTPEGLLKEWLFKRTNFSLTERPEEPNEGDNPYRLKGKEIGTFRYLESQDKRIKVAIGYRHVSPFDIPVSITKAINESSLDSKVKTILHLDVMTLLDSASIVFKQSGYPALSKLFVDHYTKIEKYISGEEAFEIPQ